MEMLCTHDTLSFALAVPLQALKNLQQRRGASQAAVACEGKDLLCNRYICMYMYLYIHLSH